jgi:DNA polymerase III subunit alpha
MEVLPLFKSHFSIGRSILTLEDEEKEEYQPNSIIDIAKDNSLKEIYLVEDNMTSFLQAYTNTKKYNINLRYGLRITFTDDIKDKTEESRQKNCKFIIFFRNEKGYRKLINIFSIAAKDGFYYEPRIDYKTIKSIWNQDDLILAVPFYDSFIFNNTLKGTLCIPDIDYAKPILFIENNNLPFDSVIKNKVISFANKNKFNLIEAKSIFYKNNDDFKTYLTFRCINNRTTLNKPELQHMTSNRFSFESLLK